MDSSSEEVILVCTNPDSIQTQTDSPNEEILISTTDILTLNSPTILNFNTIKVHALRDSLVQHSSYFRGLLSGSFSESCLGSITIKWNVQVFIQILKHINGCPLDIVSDTFVPLYEGALYFGVETLLLKCKMWLSEVFSLSSEGFQSTEIQVEDLIQFWKFGFEHATDFILDSCMSYLARNFMWATHCNSFGKIPYDMLLSSVKHPHLTVESEVHLADALLLWLGSNLENLESPSKAEAEDSCNGILKQIRVGLLPLWFAAGKRNSFHFRHLAEESIDSIFIQLNIPTLGSQDTIGYIDFQHLRIRLTVYSKKLNLFDCPQITYAVLLSSLIPSSDLTDPTLKKIIENLFTNSRHRVRDRRAFQQRQLQTVTFEAVQEVDISKCQRLLIEEAVDCFCKSFPSLRVFKAAYLLNIRTMGFLQLLEKCAFICEIDLTVDITPVLPAQVTVLSSSPAVIPPVPESSSVEYKAVEIMLFNKSGPPLSNVTKLTLEGRTDVCDLGLQYISKLCVSLCHLNIKGCISVTDIGISDLIRRCKKLNSLMVCDTSFGLNSVQALSSAISDSGSFFSGDSRDNYLNSVASNLQTLHVGGCRGICESSLLELMSQTQVLKSLCLRETNLVDQALYNFIGSSLKMLDVSNTKISGAALAYIIHRNPSLKCLKARGCKNLFQEDNSIVKRESSFSTSHEELHAELEKECTLEEVEVGWGFSTFFLSALEPALMSLKTISVGLGGTLGEYALRRLPAICPLLETISLHFQVVSDIVVMNIVTSLINLQALSLCYCLGDISMSSFKFSMQSLRKLRLERVTP
ncbi:PREDICTED: BTB/POZ domain-containing protein FBL11-like isoform X1 [Lupinus angustifolius]|uniref:BTB/POZ domain-containing protein FBL11-like isoform X1 n=1 Tax=Lupinus angustifolius TaxID=3871 RepID=UPI00092F7CB1|nr:PREDICTED: BTB/POZ domain-containing protein FBL11-like isoform X1 [Lupinus angustifolius]